MTTSPVVTITNELISELEKEALLCDSDTSMAMEPAVVAALLAERAELKRDAERYRWLRDKANFTKDDAPQVVVTDWAGCPVSVSPSAYPQGDNLDKDIDAAMQAAQ